MAGVAGPLLQRNRLGGTRFLIGIAVGGVGAGLVLAVPVFLMGQLADHYMPHPIRLALLIAVAVVLGFADLSGRTPHTWRQVPQRLVRTLPPGALGITWGFDLGLLVTTQKTSSLLWLSIIAITLLDPHASPEALVALSLIATIGIVLLSMSKWIAMVEGGMDWTWVRNTRTVTGVTMLAVALGAVLMIIA